MSTPARKLSSPITVRNLGRQDYEPLWRAMQRFTDERTPETGDEIWFTEHPPVFTLGLNASREHVLAAGDIPVVQIDRGGQVTYHGPGQLVGYPIVDLSPDRRDLRRYVHDLQEVLVRVLRDLDVEATPLPSGPEQMPMPDMGAPDFGGDFGGDMGGDW